MRRGDGGVLGRAIRGAKTVSNEIPSDCVYDVWGADYGVQAGAKCLNSDPAHQGEHHGMSWRFHSDLSDELRRVALDWARSNGLDTSRVPFNALFTIAGGQLSTEYLPRYTRVTVPLVVPLPEPFASAPGAAHAPRPPWRFDVPEVPDSVTALQSSVAGRLLLRSAAPEGFDNYPGSWWAFQLANGRLGPVAHITDIACYFPLVECVDPRAAS